MKLEQVTSDLFTDLYHKNKTAIFDSLQKNAWDKFEQIGLPDKHKEAFQYLPWHRFYGSFTQEKEAVTCDFSEVSEEGITFVWQDGKFCPELSHIKALGKQVICLPLEEALTSSYGAFLRHRIQMLTQEEEDSLALLNTAFCSGGLFLYIPPKVKIDTPIRFLSMLSGKATEYVGPRIHVFAGNSSQLQIVQSFEGVQNTSLYNGYIDLAIEEGAQVSLATHTEKNCDLQGFFSVRASLKKASFFRSYLATFGSSLLRHDYKVSLQGEGADAELFGLSLLSEAKHSHVHVTMCHNAPETRSYQKFKSVLLDQARASFTGKIHVKRVAQKTQAYQLTQSLLLSPQAITYAKPNLEIFADDVKASHGATVSQLDEEQMLYLQTRGISQKEAAALLTQGFCQEILDAFSPISLKALLTEQFQQDLLDRRGK